MKYCNDIFSSSYQRLTDNKAARENFFDVFYKNFLASSTDVFELFRETNIQQQRNVLYNSFKHMLQFAMAQTCSDEFERIAHQHSKSKLDIPPHLYDFWLESLITTVKQQDTQFTDDVDLAWRTIMAPSIAFMKFHYDLQK
jgi:hemoglobin-like flavoprotein